MNEMFVILRVVVSLIVVFGILWYARKVLAKRTRAATGTPVAVVGRRALSQKASVAVVDADGRRYVLGVTENRITVLHDGDAPESEFAAEIAAAEAGPAGSSLEGSILSLDTWRRASFRRSEDKHS